MLVIQNQLFHKDFNRYFLNRVRERLIPHVFRVTRLLHPFSTIVSPHTRPAVLRAIDSDSRAIIRPQAARDLV